MVLKDWLIEHALEILSLLVSIIGFIFAGTYLVKINNKQSIQQINSPNSPIIQAGGDVSQTDLSSFKKESRKEIAFSEEPLDYHEEDSKKQIKKIEEYLDDNKSISSIAEMSLRLANRLKMKNDIIWLEKEVRGFKEDYSKESKNEGLKFREKDEEFKYRGVEAEFNIMLNDGEIEKFNIPMFFSQPIREIEDWVERYSKDQKVIMHAPPMNLMVESFKIDPRKKVPYLVSPSSFKGVLNEVRLKILDFLERAKEKN
jgi:hypothetical protein